MIKTTVKKIFAKAGFQLQRNSNDPQHTFMGLKDRSIKTILDIGANEGQFARFALRHFPHAKILCFEPLSGAFGKLENWTKNLPNVDAFNYAIGESDERATIYLHEEHTPSSSLLRTTGLSHELYPQTDHQGTQMIQVRKLDTIVTGLTTPLIDNLMIKIDVQGFEGRVIRGGKSTFARSKACVVEVCLDSLYEGQSTFEEVLFALNSLDYRYAGNLSQVYAGDGHVIYIDAVFVK